MWFSSEVTSDKGRKGSPWLTSTQSGRAPLCATPYFPAEKATQQWALAPAWGWGVVMSSRSSPYHIGTFPAWCSPPGSHPDTTLLEYVLHPVLNTVALHWVRNMSRWKQNNPHKSSFHRLYSTQWPLYPVWAQYPWMGAELNDSFLRWWWLLHRRYS